MKTLAKILVALAILASANVMAQQDISGTWQGKLNTGGDATLTVQFIMTREADGSWSAVINSPDMGGIKNVKANSAVFDGSNLKIDVAELSGAYAGVFKDGTFEGNWSQAGSSLALNLSPYEKPVMSQADIDILLGEWVGKLKIPAGDLTLVFRFAQSDGGELQGFVRSPDQGGNEAPAADILLSGGEFSMKVPAAQVQISGTMTDKEFTGKFKQGPGEMDLTMSKGAYEPPKYVLALSKETMDQLLGEWHGEFETPMGTLTVIYRFDTNAAGEFVANRSSPDQGGSGVPIMEANLTDGKLTLKTADGAFTGTISGETIAGTVANPMGSIPLTVKKGKYVPPSYQLSLPQASIEQLLGKWQGKLATPQRTLTLIFRFESSSDGKYYGFVDSPDQGNTSLTIIEAGISEGELSLKTKFPRAEFKGKINGNNLEGQWLQGPGSMPLTMTKI